MTEKIFLRKASGIIRAMSPLEGSFYGYLASSGLGATALAFLLWGMFPNANFTFAIIVSFVAYIFIFVVYAMLGSAMPRSGGNYVFTSRILHPALGFVAAFGGWAFWQLWFSYFAGGNITSGTISPLLIFIGTITGNSAYIDANNWILLPQVRISIIILLLLASTWVMIRGLKAYTFLQNYFMMPFSFAALAILIVQFLAVPNTTFISNFNSYQNMFSPNPDWYHSLINTAEGFGLDTTPLSFSWFDTLGVTAWLTMFYMWCTWASALLGEIKGAERLKSVFLMQLGAGVLSLISFLTIFVLSRRVFGERFVRSICYLIFNHPEVIETVPGFRGGVILYILPTMSIPLGIIIILGVLGGFSQSLFNTIIGWSRLTLSMSFDRVLPRWFGGVNKRGAPKNAIYAGLIVGILFTFGYEMYPALGTALFCVSLPFYLAMLMTIIAGTVFPWAKKDIFEASAGAKYKIAGIPLITISGVIGSAFTLVSIVAFFIHPGFGVLSPEGYSSIMLVISIFVGCLIYFYAMRWHRARQGIDIDLAFKEIPPA